MAVLTVPACTNRPELPAIGSGSVVPTTPALPNACELVTPADIATALGIAMRKEGLGGGRDRCRYASDARDEVEITVDRPGREGVVDAYRALNPGAEMVEGIGDEGALFTANDKGELIFVKGPARFFVVVASPSASREALLVIGRSAAERL